MTVWFTADTHLGHGRIIDYCRRPFSGADEMELALLDNFNAVIKPCDALYHLGDVCWSSYDLGRFFGRLKTRNVQLILGNHDKKPLNEYNKYFTWVGDYKKTTLQGVQVAMFHYPMRSWNGKGHGAIHLFGHCHNKLPSHDRSMDVGVDAVGFCPISLEEVVDTLGSKPVFSASDTENHNKDRS